MTSPKHIVIHPAAGWGHIKPLLMLAARIAKQRPESAVLMTLLVPTPRYNSQIQKEIKAVPGLTKRLNVIVFVDSDGEGIVAPKTSIAGREFAPAFAKLWNGQPVWCHAAQRAISGLPRPTLAVVDIVMFFAIEDVHTIAGADCPVLSWTSLPSACILRNFGPEELGGLGDMESKIEAEAARSGKSSEEVAMSSFYRQSYGQVVHVPGLPDAYDYEAFPQEDILPIGLFLQGLHRGLLTADGAMFMACSAFDGEALRAARRWLEGLGQRVWAIAPLEEMPLPEDMPPSKGEDAKIIEFLDWMQATRGERSVIYMSFGTVFYPKDPAKVIAFISELLDMDVPFLWSHASPFTKLPDELAARMDASAVTYHANWVPQRVVLAHPATWWFVCHGGYNSVQEALGLRVPMALWPFTGDQPTTAAMLTQDRNAAFELLSVREGPAAQPPLRAQRAGINVDFTVDGVRKEVRQLLAQMRGDEGVRVRANAEKLGEAMAASWQQDGEARTQLEDMLRKYVD